MAAVVIKQKASELKFQADDMWSHISRHGRGATLFGRSCRAYTKCSELSRPAYLESALRNRDFALAAKYALGSQGPVRPYQLSAIVSGLGLFDPRRQPLHVRILGLLVEKFGDELVITSGEQAIWIESLLAYDRESGDQDLVDAGIRELLKTEGSTVPIPALMDVVEWARRLGRAPLLHRLWQYIREKYPLQVPQYGPILQRLLYLFSRQERYHPLAREIAELVLGTTSDGTSMDPALALSVARTALRLKDISLAANLQSKFDSAGGMKNLPRSVLGALLALYTTTGDVSATNSIAQELREHSTPLSDHEKAALVKALQAGHGSQAGQQYAQQIAPLKPNAARLVDYELCLQTIVDGDENAFRERHEHLRDRVPAGVHLNLKLTWILRHEKDPELGRRYYQNRSLASPIDRKQRLVALNILIDMGVEAEWVLAEAQRTNAPVHILQRRIARR